MTTTNTDADTETVYFMNGEKAGVVVREGGEWVGFDLSDHEAYRGKSFVTACDAVRGW